jgi:hypothetical protein
VAVERAGAQHDGGQAPLAGPADELGQQPARLLRLGGPAGLERGGVPGDGLPALLFPGGTVVGVHGDDPNGIRVRPATRVLPPADANHATGHDSAE